MEYKNIHSYNFKPNSIVGLLSEDTPNESGVRTSITIKPEFFAQRDINQTLNNIIKSHQEQCARIGNPENIPYVSFRKSPVEGIPDQFETSIPAKDMLGVLLTEGLINEQEMLDAYKSLDFGKDNKFLNKQNEPARSSWVSSLF